MEQMAKTKFPDSMVFEWTGMSYQEKQVGSEERAVINIARKRSLEASTAESKILVPLVRSSEANA
jgi:hypothetical protein